MSDDGKSYERGRLMRGATRPVKRLGPMQFRVKGNHAAFWDVNLELDVPCQCPDAEYHGRPCLHEISARLQNGDAGLIQALGEQLLAAQRRSEELERRTRRARKAS